MCLQLYGIHVSLSINPEAVEKGTKAVISANFRLFSQRTFMTYKMNFWPKRLEKSFSTATANFTD